MGVVHFGEVVGLHLIFAHVVCALSPNSPTLLTVAAAPAAAHACIVWAPLRQSAPCLMYIPA